MGLLRIFPKVTLLPQLGYLNLSMSFTNDQMEKETLNSLLSLFLTNILRMQKPKLILLQVSLWQKEQ